MTVKKINSNYRKIIDNMKLSMPVAEAGPKGYQAMNDDTYAMGMYQFVPYWHLDDMREFAKATDSIYIDESQIPTKAEFEKLRASKDSAKVKAMLQPILDSTAFQDAFFDNYMVDVIDEAQIQYNKYGKKTGWSLEGFVALNHLEGIDGAKKRLKSSEKNPEVLNTIISETNPVTVNDYVSKHTNAIEKAGGKLNAPEQFDLETGDALNPNREKEYKTLKKRYDAITNNNEMSDEQKASALDNVYKDIKSIGFQDEFTKTLQEENEVDQKAFEDFKNAKTAGGVVHKMVQEDMILRDGDRQRTVRESNKSYDQDDTYYIPVNRHKDVHDLIDGLPPEEQKKIKKALRLGTKNPSGKTRVGFGTSALLKQEGFKNFLKLADDEYLKIEGKNLYFDPKIIRDKDGNIQRTNDGENIGYTINVKDDIKNIQTPDWKENKHYVPDFEKIKTNEQVREEAEAKVAKETEEETGVTTTTEDTGEAKANVATGNLKNLTEEERLKYENDYFSNFLQQETIDVPDSFEYDKRSFKKEIPFEAIGYGALGLIGSGEAKTEDPLRDEKVSEAIINLAKTQKRISELGLKPEEEALMKKNINDNFRFGMDNLVRSSGGNRNLVQGGQNALNKNRLEGIANVSLADVQTRLEGLKQYGDTLQYIENFNTNRDIANHGIKLQNAREKRQAGQALAASGFTSMIEEFAYQKNNGPGSANHMKKQADLYELLGYVPGANIEAGKPGSYEYKRQQELNIAESNKKANVENDLNAKVRNRIESMSREDFSKFQRDGGFRTLKEEGGRERFLGIDNPQVQQQVEPIEEQPQEASNQRYRSLGFSFLA